MSESKTSVRRITATERQRKALELRKAGASYEEIANSLGYRGKTGAYKAVTSALKKMLKEPADEVRKLELARLDALSIPLWRQAGQGNQGATDRLLRIMERRARLLGLDAAEKQLVIEATVEQVIGLLPEAWQKEIRDAIVAAG